MKDYESNVILQCHAELEWLAPNGEQDDDWDWRLEYEGRKGDLTILESTTIHPGQNYAFLLLPNGTFFHTSCGAYYLQNNRIILITKQTVYFFRVLSLDEIEK